MMNCKEISRKVASSEMDQVSWMKRLSLKLHHLLCRHCRNYSHQISNVGQMAREWAGEISNPEEVERVKEEVLERVKNGENLH